MKILVPTDFSSFANDAFEAALLIAQKVGAELHIYHSASIPDHWEDLPAQEQFEDQLNKAIDIEVKKKMAALKVKGDEKGIQCHYHYTGGKFLKNIEEVTDQIDFDLIVMGSHGVSGKEEWWLGSNTQKVVRKLHNNVLVIKKPLTDLNFTQVVFVTGLNEEDKESFQRFLNFIELFEVEQVHVLCIDTPSWFTQPTFIMHEALEDFKELAGAFDCKTHFYQGISVDTDTIKFTAEHPVDIIGISNRKRHPVKRFFSGSNVEMLVNYSDVPVLTIDY